ncbi:MAG: hypothetical protein EB015_12110 [Methylocystaceae bacterium]|nr:hypothetical protein [Methylocystaceae bacterium]
MLIPFSVTPVASADAAYDLPDLVCPSGARLAKGKHFPSVEAARATSRATEAAAEAARMASNAVSAAKNLGLINGKK